MWRCQRGHTKRSTAAKDFSGASHIAIPRATTYRFVPSVKDNFIICLEAHSEILPATPEQKGMVGMHAIFDMGAVSIPDFEPYDKSQENTNGKEYEIRIKRLGEYT